MNKKILGIIAGIATVGSAVFAAPAHAVKQDVEVTVTIQPGIYLRTFEKVNLQVTQGDLGATKESDFNATPETDGSGKLTLLPAPTIGTGANPIIKKSVTELFAVWGNTAGKNVTVTVKPVMTSDDGQSAVLKNDDETSEITITGVTVTGEKATGVPTSKNPLVGGVDLDLDVSQATAGVHSGGKLTVEALADL
ncbi:MAG: hypothetical protein HC903_00210 [Methylacidiphilales bacterium]|nr:hypothetical protein [Candidatus Methylacidiphilales bacterium]NJR14722.1 hypothetical protein [Calothrix sp. CSU_2_0]